MSFCFVPDFFARKLTDISPGFLRSEKIEVLLCDLDNTISLHRHKRPPDEVFRWKKTLDEAGIELVLFSNNRRGRASRNARMLGVKCFERIGKPRTAGFFEAARVTDVPLNRMALAGDQIFTDVLGANRAEVKSIWVVPIDRRVPHIWLRFAFERLVVAVNMIFGGKTFEKL